MGGPQAAEIGVAVTACCSSRPRARQSQRVTPACALLPLVPPLQGLEVRDSARERRPAAAARVRGGGENLSRDGREGEVGWAFLDRSLFCSHAGFMYTVCIFAVLGLCGTDGGCLRVHHSATPVLVVAPLVAVPRYG